MEINQKLAEQFSIIATLYSNSEPYRARAYSRASNLISHYNETITSGKQARANLSGIGTSIAADIDEYLATGKITRLIQLENKNIELVPPKEKPIDDEEKNKIIDLFKSIHGIGEVKANIFYQMGCRTLQDLIDKAPLTNAQRLGIIYLEHFSVRIPRSEMDIINEHLTNIFKSYDDELQWIITGSYRRNEMDSGDIDVLIKAKENVNLTDIVNILTNNGIIIGNLALGKWKYYGILRLSDEYNAHRLDIQIINPESWASALLYFTGSQQFNILMRQRALDLGFHTLNEYGLEKEPGVPVAVNNEQDIFEQLKVQYLAPEQRTRDLTGLPLID